MSIGRFVFNVRRVDGDFAFLFLWRPINVLVRHGLSAALFAQNLGNGLCQGSVCYVKETANDEDQSQESK